MIGDSLTYHATKQAPKATLFETLLRALASFIEVAGFRHWLDISASC